VCRMGRVILAGQRAHQDPGRKQKWQHELLNAKVAALGCMLHESCACLLVPMPSARSGLTHCLGRPRDGGAGVDEVERDLQPGGRGLQLPFSSFITGVLQLALWSLWSLVLWALCLCLCRVYRINSVFLA
jgi:hypothetical protein